MDGNEVVRTVERVPAALTHNLETLNQRITDLEKRPVPLTTHPEDSDETRQQRDRIAEIERQLAEAISSPPAVIPQDDDLSDRVEFVVKRLAALESRLTEYAGRLDEIAARPHISEETIRQLDDGLNAKIRTMIESHVNKAMGDVRSRLVTVERNATTVIEGEPQSKQLAKLADVVRNFGECVKTVESDFDERIAHVEQMYAEVAEHITDNNLKTMQLSTRLYRALKALEQDDAAA